MANRQLREGGDADTAGDLAAANTALLGRDLHGCWAHITSINSSEPEPLPVRRWPARCCFQLRAQRALESDQRASILPDVPVYDTTSSVSSTIECATAAIRAELDQIMEFRDRCPPFTKSSRKWHHHPRSQLEDLLLRRGMDCSQKPALPADQTA